MQTNQGAWSVEEVEHEAGGEEKVKAEHDQHDDRRRLGGRLPHHRPNLNKPHMY